MFRTNRNWLSRQDHCQTRKSSRLHIFCISHHGIRPIMESGSQPCGCDA